MSKQELKEGQKVWVRALYRGVDPEDDESLKISLKDKGGRNWVFVDADEVLVHHPKKVVVPQFVADHIEYLRGLNSPMRDIFGCFDDKRLKDWLCQESDADEILAHAWLDGFEVEKLYTVEIADLEKPNGKKTNLAKFKGKVFLSSTVGAAPLTEAEIKRNHAWAWPFAREVLE